MKSKSCHQCRKLKCQEWLLAGGICDFAVGTTEKSLSNHQHSWTKSFRRASFWRNQTLMPKNYYAKALPKKIIDTNQKSSQAFSRSRVLPSHYFIRNVFEGFTKYEKLAARWRLKNILFTRMHQSRGTRPPHLSTEWLSKTAQIRIMNFQNMLSN